MFSKATLASAWLVLMLSAGPARGLAPPSSDPFYDQPQNISLYLPGEVIRSRQLPNNITDPTTNKTLPITATYQYLFRTQDSFYKPVAAVTTLLVPSENRDPSRLLSFQLAYDSAENVCSPSYTLQDGTYPGGTEVAYISSALKQGWYVVTPDYEGLQAQYAAGIQSGLATLDSIRAVYHESHDNGVAQDASVIAWGYSGGALATEWAMELQLLHAPELLPLFKGAAMGGDIPNDTSLLYLTNDTPNVGIDFLGLFGISKAYPQLAQFLQKHLLPSKKDEFYDIATQCEYGAIAKASGMDIQSYFDTANTTFEQPAVKSAVTEAGQQGRHGVPAVPLFFYKSEGDQFGPIADLDKLVDQYCDEHVNLRYLRDSVGNHNTEAVTGSAPAFEWIKARFEGQAITIGCDIQNVTLSCKTIERAKDLGQASITYLTKEAQSEGIC